VNLRAAAIALAHFLAPHVSASGESADVYDARVTIVGSVSADVAEGGRYLGWRGRKVELTAALLVLIDEESRFDERVHAGTKHPTWTGDDGHSVCLMQVQRSRLTPGFDQLVGTDETSTHHCLSAGARIFAAQYGACARGPVTEDSMAVAFTAYAVGHCAGASELGRARARKWMKAVRRLEARP